MSFSSARFRTLLTNEFEALMQQGSVSGYGVRRVESTTVAEIHVYGDIGAARSLSYAISDVEVESLNLTLDETASMVAMKLSEQLGRLAQ